MSDVEVSKGVKGGQRGQLGLKGDPTGSTVRFDGSADDTG